MIENAVYIGWEMRLLIINQITLIGSNKMKHNMNSIMPCMEEMAKKKILIRWDEMWNWLRRKKSWAFYCHLNTFFPHHCSELMCAMFNFVVLQELFSWKYHYVKRKKFSFFFAHKTDVNFRRFSSLSCELPSYVAGKKKFDMEVYLVRYLDKNYSLITFFFFTHTFLT